MIIKSKNSGKTKYDLKDTAYSDKNIEFSYAEFERIAKDYDLGNISSGPILEKGGAVNYNFKLKTDKGTYMIRARQQELSLEKRKSKDLEYAVTDHLNKKDFPYNVPLFLENKDGRKLSELEGKTYEVYERLPGIAGNHDNSPSSEELVKIIAQYHNGIKDLTAQRSKASSAYDSSGWLDKQLKIIEEKSKYGKTPEDKLIRENISFIFDTYNTLRESSIPGKNTIIAHNDFHAGNLLYQDGKITGIIDFGNVRWSPKGRDLKKFASKDLSEFDNIIESYREHNPISEKESSEVFQESIYDNLGVIRWIYQGMKKNPSNRKRFLEYEIKKLKTSVENWENYSELKAA